MHFHLLINTMKYILLFVVFACNWLYTTAQIKKTPTVQQPSKLPQTMPLPPYLKLVTPTSELYKKRVAAAPKPIQSRPGFNAASTNILVNGMDPESIVNYQEILKRNNQYNPGDTVPVALTFPDYPSTQYNQRYNRDASFRAVLPIRQNDGAYFFDISAPAPSNAVWTLRYRPNSSLSLLTTFQFVASGDQTCFFVSTQGDLLSLVPRAGQTPAVAMRKPTEPIKTRWYIYQHRCPNVWLWLYNAQYKVFLGRTLVGNRVAFVAVPAADVLNNRVPANVSTNWDLRLQNAIAGYVRSNFNYLPDRDGDGFADAFCGGEDCDDYDPSRYPGATEVCDPNGKDEDCDPVSIGYLDRDGDGYISNTCYHGTQAGEDCDDNNPAIKPGAMIYISETQVEVCGRGICVVESSMRAVRQPNGTAIVVPR